MQMKIFTILFSVIAVGLIIFNATKLNFNALFEGESMIALITILASVCAIILVQILSVSKRIEQKTKKK